MALVGERGLQGIDRGGVGATELLARLQGYGVTEEVLQTALQEAARASAEAATRAEAALRARETQARGGFELAVAGFATARQQLAPGIARLNGRRDTALQTFRSSSYDVLVAAAACQDLLPELLRYDDIPPFAPPARVTHQAAAVYVHGRLQDPTFDRQAAVAMTELVGSTNTPTPGVLHYLGRVARLCGSAEMASPYDTGRVTRLVRALNDPTTNEAIIDTIVSDAGVELQAVEYLLTPPSA